MGHEPFLKALAQAARKHPDLDGHVFWGADTHWTDAAGDPLDAEELAFYAEGLLMEGFGVIWRLLENGGQIGPFQLFCWQGLRPALPDPAQGGQVLASGEVIPG